jgi:hypothetical protein
VKGSTPRIENQMTNLAPNRSPIGPPRNTPIAEAPRKTNSRSCASCTPTWNLSIRKKV